MAYEAYFGFKGERRMKVKKIILSMVLTFVLAFSMTGAVFATTVSANDSKEDTAPAYDITINIVPEKGWLVNNSKVNIKVIDNKNTGTFRIAKVEAKIGAEGKYEDITDTMSLEVSEKCSVYVTVTDSYGTIYTQTRYIDGYDTTPPTFNVAVNNGVMVIETNDSESGVEAIYINGYKYKPNKQGKLTVRLQKFDATYTNFSIYVVDKSGNESEAYVIDNPYYKQASSDEDSDDSSNPADSLPTSGEATEKNESSADILSVTDEDGNDISDEVNSKQFYSIVTKDGQTFYLVIDMDGGLQYGDNDYTGQSSGTVYFLTYVSNNDLLNVTDSDEVTLGYNSIAAGNNINEEAVSDNTENAEESNEEDKDKDKEKEADEKDSSGTVVVIIVIIMVAVVLIAVKSKSSGKSKTPNEDEFDDDEDEFVIEPDNYEETTPLSDLDEKEEEL